MEVSKERINGLYPHEKERSLYINRIPIFVKENFVEYAKEEFAGDYGLLLKWCFEQAIEYQRMKIMFFKGELSQTEESTASQEEQPDEKVIKTMSGRKLKGGKEL